MPLELLKFVLGEISSVGINEACLTGGEPALHPDLEEIFDLFAKYKIRFNLVSNGFIFTDKILPLFKPKIRKYLTGVCFSLDGSTADSHDLIRGKGSYEQVISSITSCVKEGIIVFVKSILHSENIDEITDTAFLCSSLGVANLSFIVLTPAPHFISSGLMPSPKEYGEAIKFIKGRIQPSFSMVIDIEGYADPDFKIPFCNPVRGMSIDHEGNLIFCCNLSHPTAEDKPDALGKESLGNIKEIGIEEGIIRQYRLFGWFAEKIININLERPSMTCTDCLQLFGKMDWIKSYESPYNRYY